MSANAQRYSSHPICPRDISFQITVGASEWKAGARTLVRALATISNEKVEHDMYELSTLIDGLGSRLALAVILVLVLSLFFVGLVSAHGGTGEDLHGPAPAWMIALIYVQLIMIPLIGVWLIREALSAWLSPARRIIEEHNK